MITMRMMIWSTVAFVASISASYAGPCSGDIDRIQARIDATLEAKAAVGPYAGESANAGMSDQPTPRSMAAAEEKLGEISPQKADVVAKAMARARAADNAGDNGACERALAEVRRLLGPHKNKN